MQLVPVCVGGDAKVCQTACWVTGWPKFTVPLENKN